MLRVFIWHFVWYSFWVLYESIVWMWDLCLKNKTLLRRKFYDHKKAVACGKCPWSRKEPWLVETFLMNGLSLREENFLDEGKILACGRKLPWSRKILCLWKTYLMKEKPWLVESLLDERNIFAWGKLPWRSKNLGL